jgi:hypoxanthine phosphoribosyltransferase
MQQSHRNQIAIKEDIEIDISGKHVLLVDTIIDMGETMAWLLMKFGERGPASLKAAGLLDKKYRRTVDVPMSYIGFEIPDKFVVGYGMNCPSPYIVMAFLCVL